MYDFDDAAAFTNATGGTYDRYLNGSPRAGVSEPPTTVVDDDVPPCPTRRAVTRVRVQVRIDLGAKGAFAPGRQK